MKDDIEILFTRRKIPGSWLIRAVTWSRWSHVEIIVGKSVLGADAPEGVALVPLSERISIAENACIMTIPCDSKAAISWAWRNIGKPYDWWGILGLGLHHDWEDESKWWCSEFVGKALQKGGALPYRPETIKRLTPEHLWMMNFPVETVK